MRALPTFVFRELGKPDAPDFQEMGRTFEEATKHWDFINPKLVRIAWEKYAWPGGYPLYYYTKDGGCLCSSCANAEIHLTLGDDPQWQITEVDINYEDDTLYCDHCYEFIERAYGD